jgi:hypothetical protein
MRRSAAGFTDGRIHVTLWEGAVDLAGLEAGDRGVYEGLLSRWRGGEGLEGFEGLWREGGFACVARLRRRGVLGSLFRDLCRRLALEGSGCRVRVEESWRPWEPEASRALFVEEIGYVAPGEGGVRSGLGEVGEYGLAS